MEEKEWASSPWDSALDYADEAGLSYEALAKRLGLDFDELIEMAKADEPWSEDLARRMCRAVGGDVSFWLRRSLDHERMKLRLKMDELTEKTQEMLEILEGAKNVR